METTFLSMEHPVLHICGNNNAWKQHSHQWNTLSMEHPVLRGSRIFWSIWLRLFRGIWRMEREVRPDYLYIRSYIWKSTIRKVIYIRRNIVNDWLVKLQRQTTYWISLSVFSQTQKCSKLFPGIVGKLLLQKVQKNKKQGTRFRSDWSGLMRTR